MEDQGSSCSRVNCIQYSIVNYSHRAVHTFNCVLVCVSTQKTSTSDTFISDHIHIFCSLLLNLLLVPSRLGGLHALPFALSIEVSRCFSLPPHYGLSTQKIGEINPA